jgi:predicted nucleic acid-binding protein
MLLDANPLLYAVHNQSAQHEAAVEWLTAQLNGSRRVGLPWQTLAGFLRIATHPRAFERPLPAATAWERVTDWLSAPVAWCSYRRSGRVRRRAAAVARWLGACERTLRGRG